MSVTGNRSRSSGRICANDATPEPSSLVSRFGSRVGYTPRGLRGREDREVRASLPHSSGRSRRRHRARRRRKEPATERGFADTGLSPRLELRRRDLYRLTLEQPEAGATAAHGPRTAYGHQGSAPAAPPGRDSSVLLLPIIRILGSGFSSPANGHIEPCRSWAII